MTPERPDVHPSEEEVDALLDRPGARGDGDPVATHVAACASCTTLRDALVEVRALLRQEAAHVPEPPTDLESRISEALAAQRPLGAGTGPRPEVAASSGAGTPDDEPGWPEQERRSAHRSPDDPPTTVTRLPRRRRSGGPLLAAAAALAVVAGAGAVVVDLTRGGGDAGSVSLTSTDAGADAEEMAPAQAAPAVVRSGARYSADNLPLLVAGLVATTDDLDDLDDADPEAVAPLTGPRAATQERGTSGPQTTDQAPAPGIAGEGAEDDAPLEQPGGLQACLAALGVPEAGTAAVDLARWAQVPAAVLVLEEPADPRHYRVMVVDPGCGDGGEPTVLSDTRQDR